MHFNLRIHQKPSMVSFMNCETFLFRLTVDFHPEIAICIHAEVHYNRANIDEHYMSLILVNSITLSETAGARALINLRLVASILLLQLSPGTIMITSLLVTATVSLFSSRKCFASVYLSSQ